MTKHLRTIVGVAAGAVMLATPLLAFEQIGQPMLIEEGPGSSLIWAEFDRGDSDEFYSYVNAFLNVNPALREQGATWRDVVAAICVNNPCSPAPDREVPGGVSLTGVAQVSTYQLPIGVRPQAPSVAAVVAELQDGYADQQQALDSIATLAAQNGESLADVFGRLDGIAGTVEETVAQLTDALAAVADNSADIADVRQSVDGNTNAIAAATARVLAVEEVLEALPEDLAQRVDDVENNIGAMEGRVEALEQKGFVTADAVPAVWPLWLSLGLLALALVGAVLLARRMFYQYKEKQEADNKDRDEKVTNQIREVDEKVAGIAATQATQVKRLDQLQLINQAQHKRLEDHEERTSDIAAAASDAQYDRRKVAVDYLTGKEVGEGVHLSIDMPEGLYSVLINVVKHDYQDGEGPVRAYALEGIKRSARENAPPTPLRRPSQVATWVDRATRDDALLSHRVRRDSDDMGPPMFSSLRNSGDRNAA
jgi:hypothetical protein